MTYPYKTMWGWDDLPDEAKLALCDLKVGEFTSFTVADDDNPSVAREYRLMLTLARYDNSPVVREYRLTLRESILVTEEEFEHLRQQDVPW